MSVPESAVLVEAADPALPLQVNAAAASANLADTSGVLMGWSLVEPTATADAVVSLVDGGADGSPILGEIVLAAGGSESEGLGPRGVLVRSGVRLVVTSGQVTGAVWFAPDRT